MRKIEDLHPKLQDLIYDLKTESEKQGLKIGISECLRTKEEQDELYAKGRTQKGSIVTNAKGETFSSMHQWGVAFDFYRNDGKGIYNNEDKFFNKVGKIGRELGLEWGGGWKSIVDLPHFQLSDWGSTTAKLKSMYKIPENFFKTWEDNAMTAEERQKFNTLIERVEKLTLAQEKVYHYTKELPEYPDGTGRKTIQKLLDKGIFAGASADDLNLPETLFRMYCTNDRAGLYK